MTDTETALTTDIPAEQPAERDALLFRAGVYPGKGLNGSALTITESDLQAIAENTDSVPLIFAHDAERERLDFGTVGGLEARGNELWGKVRLAAESVSFVAKNGLRSLSVGLDYADKRLKETSFTRRPHIKDAAMFSESDSCAVFSVGEEPENSFDAGEIVEFDDKGGSVSWVTIDGNPVPVMGSAIGPKEIADAQKTHSIGPEGHAIIKDAQAHGEITTDSHLANVIGHAKKLEAGGVSSEKAYQTAVDAKGTRTRDGRALSTPEQREAAKARDPERPVPPRSYGLVVHPENDIRAASFYDKAGRSQTVYTKAHREGANDVKFDSLHHFAQELPKIRQRVESDLTSSGLSKDKVNAAVVRIMDATTARVGGEANAKDTDFKSASYGASSLRKEHVSVEGDTVHLNFPGKDQVQWSRSITDPKLAETVKRLQTLPGDKLFQHTDAAGLVKGGVNENTVREYLKPNGVNPHRFRTYHGTEVAAQHLASLPAPKDQKEFDSHVKAAAEKASALLGNQPAMALKSYINPAVLRDHRNKSMANFVKLDMERPDPRLDYAGYLDYLKQEIDAGRVSEEPLSDTLENPEPAAKTEEEPKRAAPDFHKKSGAAFSLPLFVPKSRRLRQTTDCNLPENDTAQFSCATKGRLMPNLITALLDRLRGKDLLSDEEIAQFTADAHAQDAQFEQDEQTAQTALFAEVTEAKAETAYGELFAAGKILPPEKPGFIADFCQLASDDRRSPAVITFSDGEKEVKASRVERLKARYADRDKMAMFKEVLDEAPQDALVLFNAMKTKTAGAEKPVTPERIDQLLAMTPEGRAILAERGK